MSQRDIDEAVALASGESFELIHVRGFSIADSLDVTYDPEPRQLLVFDWDRTIATDWPPLRSTNVSATQLILEINRHGP